VRARFKAVLTFTASVSVASLASPSPVILLEPAARFEPRVPEVIVALVNVVIPVKLPVVIIVPVTSGIVTVLSAVGSVTVNVVSLPSGVEPSKTILTRLV
jgi:hypothetical protein